MAEGARDMSDYGGMDRGLAGDQPHLGRVVAYQPAEDVFVAGIVQAVREDGWTVALTVGANEYEFVPYGGTAEFGEIPVGTWVTLDAYEGWLIYEQERALKKEER